MESGTTSFMGWRSFSKYCALSWGSVALKKSVAASGLCASAFMNPVIGSVPASLFSP